MLRLTVRGLSLLAGLTLAGAAWADEVNVYSSRHYKTDQAIYDAFTRAAGVKVNVIEGEHDELIQRLKAEGASSPADLFITTDAGRLAEAAEKGLLAPVKTPALESVVPAHLRDPNGLWWGLSTRARVIVYARDRVKPGQIKDYEDLAKPEWKGKVLTRSGSHPYNLALTASLIAALGEEKAEAWARGLVANFARAPKGGDTDQIRAVAAGEGDVALSNSYYLAKLAASDKPEDRAAAGKVGVIFPNQAGRGAHVNLSGAGATATAPHRENAVKLLEFLASPEAQRQFADGNMEYPVNRAVKPHAVLESFGVFKEEQVNAAAYARNGAAALRIMDRAGWR